MPQFQDFQFFQTERLNELYEKEQAFELHKHSLAAKEAAARAQVHCLSCTCILLLADLVSGLMGADPGE